MKPAFPECKARSFLASANEKCGLGQRPNMFSILFHYGVSLVALTSTKVLPAINCVSGHAGLPLEYGEDRRLRKRLGRIRDAEELDESKTAPHFKACSNCRKVRGATTPKQEMAAVVARGVDTLCSQRSGGVAPGWLSEGPDTYDLNICTDRRCRQQRMPVGALRVYFSACRTPAATWAMYREKHHLSSLHPLLSALVTVAVLQTILLSVPP